MANKTILTTQSKTVQVETLYLSPVAVLPSATQFPIGTIYCFLSKVDPWSDDEDPEQPTGDVLYMKQAFKNMFVAKKITSSDIAAVIPRVNWTANTIYDSYTDTIDMTAVDINGNQIYNYYVKNKYDQVFKCLWNNNGGLSTHEPFFEPGSYNANKIYQNSDGYKWKYIYTVDTGLKIKFMDNTWMPIIIGANTPNPLQSTAGVGSIDVINVTNGGSGYDPSNAAISIVVDGDGTGLSASANVISGVVQDIIVTNPGSNYSYANVSIVSTLGSGATATSPTSPIGGHGFDPISELGCRHLMMVSQFEGSENGVIPTDNDYHQVGLIINPTTYESPTVPANGAIYRTTTDIVVSPGFGTYSDDEFIYQGTSLENSTFSARVLSFDTATNLLYVINTKGNFSLNSPIVGESSKTTRTLLTYNTPNFAPFSGYIIFMENRSAVQRSADGIEQFKFVLGF